MQRRVKKEKEVTLSRRETSNVRCRENVAQEEDQSIFVSTEKHLVLFPPLPLLPRPLVCLSRLLHSPPTCLSQFLRDRSIFFFFFFSSLFPLVHAFSPSSTFRTFSSSPPRLHDWARRNPDQWGGEASHSLSKLPRRFLPLSLSPSRSRIEHFVTK